MVNLDNIVETKKRKNNLTVGIDVDNVLFYIPILEYINSQFNENFNDSDLSDWSFSNFSETIRSEIFAAFRSTEFMCNSKPYWGNFCTLRDWAAEGHRLYAVTRRSWNLYDSTCRQLEKHYPGLFMDCIFVKENESKTKYLKSIGANVHIDDYDVEDSLNAGIKTWLITNDKTCYNHGFRTNPYLHQASSISHVKNILKSDEKWLS